MKLSVYFKKFFQSSQSSGILLIFCVAVALTIANSPLGKGFQDFLDLEMGFDKIHLKYSVSSWINDGLMAIFFLLVGLEIKRELMEGELSSFKNASLPVFAAIGGMLIPALIFTAINYGNKYSSGWGIPMATDIAFSLAVIALLGKRVPASLKIFLAALAIVDDLGAILVIAIFYTEQIHWIYLLLSFGITAVLFILNFLKIKKLIFYLIPGIFLWYFLHHSGIHATIAGVIVALSIPTNTSETKISPLEKLEHSLHIPVGFFIMPLFALTNTNIEFKSGMTDVLTSGLGAGIIGGLVLGKLFGINLFSLIAIKLKISSLPQNSSWSQMTGVGLLAGIGFTMSIFIALLSFKNDVQIQNEAKFAVLIASVIAAVSGALVLRISPAKIKEDFKD
ncbi:Na+/H+ antiporter NhaA [Chryseobacterium caseinilyticum]|uniref:Na(+)/H(+) antiporter NhaA n=1 Tax=Chryseobacterium caseinilyticum TaxID=2771428 RepID=A0ABR8Z7Y8_9FLAO|nr:Na+/H+ antiporter NhaA [Chryseobacterium caseinilyticum]MBD8081414.1 Na+/H+ antiporter NhaA [Chryseobacterium caseinilyticum]